MKSKKLFVSITFAILFIILPVIVFRWYGSFRLQKAAEMFQKEAGELLPGDYAPPHPAVTENGGILLEAGAYASVLTGEEFRILRPLAEKPSTAWDSESIAAARPVVARNEAAYQLMFQAVPLEKSSFGLKYEMAWYMPIPKYLKFLHANSILGSRARVQLIENHPMEVLQTMSVLERMAAALLHEPVLLSCLIGIVVQKDYDALVQEMLFRADADMLLTIEKQLQHLRAMTVPINRIFASDGAATYATFREKYAADEGNQVTTDRLPRWFYRANRRLFLAQILESYTDIVNRSTVPFAKHATEPFRSKWSPRRLVDEALSISDRPAAIGRIQSASSEVILAELAVKLCSAARRNGNYPPDLSKFPPMPSPYTGEPVHYELQSDGSAVLSYPEADRFWDKLHKQGGVPRKPIFVWKLPPSK